LTAGYSGRLGRADGVGQGDGHQSQAAGRL